MTTLDERIEAALAEGRAQGLREADDIAEPQWIMWHGGECPVDRDGTRGEARLRDGTILPLSDTGDWRWKYDEGNRAIVAYRVYKDRKPTVALTRSDGGSTSYYRLPEHATELRHLISHKSMSKSRGDIFKACYRLGEKEGADILYDLKKMEFFIQDLIEMHERGEHI